MDAEQEASMADVPWLVQDLAGHRAGGAREEGMLARPPLESGTKVQGPGSDVWVIYLSWER